MAVAGASAEGAWEALLRPEVELGADFGRRFADILRAKRLTFGDRVHCQVLRPFFLTKSDEARVRVVAETVARLGERVTEQALEDSSLFRQLGLTEDEERLVRIDPGYRTASTSSRLDAFLLPDSLWCAEYNAESPAGMGYAETLIEVFESLDIMRRFAEQFEVQRSSLTAKLLAALVASYREFGGGAASPVVAIVDWRDVPTWSEFEILRDRFERLGTRAMVCDPRELDFDGRTLSCAGEPIDLVYRRVLTADIVARAAECEALVGAYRARAVCLANSLRCKMCQKKAFFAVLTDDTNAHLFTGDERALIGRHIPWTRVVADVRTERAGQSIELAEHIRCNRAELVLKPSDEYGGKGVVLGWEASASQWDATLDEALGGESGVWVVQARIPVRRERFPRFETGGHATFQEMLVDFAPYLFRGRLAGYLTRLSASGLANVTSGGGQVPAFVAEPRRQSE